jgi:alpha-tubulin suppressor-like RCC1 family protein
MGFQLPLYVSSAPPAPPTTGLFYWGLAASAASASSIRDPMLPFEFVSSDQWTKISIAGSHWMGIKNGELWVGGDGINGATGNGSTDAQFVPLYRVGSDSDWTDCSAGSNRSLAIRAGRLYVTGQGANGALGYGSTGNVTTFTQIGSDTDWNKIVTSPSSNISFAIKNNALYACGNNTSFSTGLNTSSGNTLTWTLSNNSETFTNISTGQVFGLAIGGGKLFSWGNNNAGRTGQGTISGNTQVPTQIGSDTNWQSCSAAFAWGMAIKTTGTLWAWGNAQSGQLGTGTTTTQNSPIQSGSDSDWAETSQCPVLLNGYFSYARKTNGTIWGCGNNLFYQIGQSTIQATNSSWLQIGTATNHTLIAAGPGFGHTVRT